MGTARGASSVASAAGRDVAKTLLGLLPGGRRWPQGVNDWRVRGGTPVVLVPGSFVPGEFYWHRLAPGLIADGHRVYACNLPGLGTREPQTMVAALAEFVEQVRESTGADRVVLVEQRPEEPYEHCEQQRADVAAVDVGVGHDDNLVITQLIDRELIADIHTHSNDQVLDFVISKHFVQA